MTRAEQRVAEAIRADYPQAALMSEQQVARAAGVSAASVGRYAVKLGYKGFRDLQAALGVEMRTQLASPTQRLAVGGGQRGSAPLTILDQVIQITHENLSSARELVDEVQLTQLISALARRRGSHVYVAGSNKGWVVASYFAIQLRQIRAGVVLLDLNERLTDQLLDLNRADIAVVFEPRRMTAALLRVVNQALERHALLAAFTDERPPRELATVPLLFRAHVDAVSVFDSYAGLFALCDAVLASLVHRLSPSVGVRLERLEALHREFETWG